MIYDILCVDLHKIWMLGILYSFPIPPSTAFSPRLSPGPVPPFTSWNFRGGEPSFDNLAWMGGAGRLNVVFPPGFSIQPSVEGVERGGLGVMCWVKLALWWQVMAWDECHWRRFPGRALFLPAACSLFPYTPVRSDRAGLCCQGCNLSLINIIMQFQWPPPAQMDSFPGD